MIIFTKILPCFSKASSSEVSIACIHSKHQVKTLSLVKKKDSMKIYRDSKSKNITIQTTQKKD